MSFTRVVREGANLSDVQVDTGGGDIITPEHSHAPGDDCFPLGDDQPIVMLTDSRSGGGMVVGYVEPDCTQKAQVGERRSYARKEDRSEVNEVWLKNDGEILLDNDEARITVFPDGKIETKNGEVTQTLYPDGKVVTVNPVSTQTMLADGTNTLVNANATQTMLPDGTMSMVNTGLAAFVMASNGIITINGVTFAPTTGAVVAPSTLFVAGKNIGVHDHPAGNPPGNTGNNN